MDRGQRALAVSGRADIVPHMRAKVLIVDDEPHIVDILRAYMAREGYAVVSSGDGEEGLRLARTEAPDVLILDVMLPGLSGFDLLRALRGEGSRAGVIMLTARDDVIDRVAGLELGADDYVLKPFEPREVVARVGALIRRVQRLEESGSGEAGRVRFFDLEVDLGSREAWRGGAPVPITRTEFDLLIALIEQPGRVWTREQLGARLFGEGFDAFDRTIDSHVKNLRRKLGTRPDGGVYLETVRGVGYRAAREQPVRPAAGEGVADGRSRGSAP
jgi:DNA-binding response OmpR family regulator